MAKFKYKGDYKIHLLTPSFRGIVSPGDEIELNDSDCEEFNGREDWVPVKSKKSEGE